MKKNVEIVIDLNVARRMLRVAGFSNITKETSDEEVFLKVLTMLEKYGAKSTIN